MRWVDGATTPIKLLHLDGIRERVRELHAEGLIARQIRDRLAAGDSTTGQKWEYAVTHINQILKGLRLRPNSVQTAMKPLRAELDELYSPRSDPRRDRRAAQWRRSSDFSRAALDAECGVLLAQPMGRRSHLEQSHRELLADVKGRSLTEKQAAEEFNRDGVPRAGGDAWIADTVRQRRVYLGWVGRRRVRKDGMINEKVSGMLAARAAKECVKRIDRRGETSLEASGATIVAGLNGRTMRYYGRGRSLQDSCSADSMSRKKERARPEIVGDGRPQ